MKTRKPAGRWTQQDPLPGDACQYIRHLDELLRRTLLTHAVIYCRVSGREQNRRRNLEAQEAYCRQVLAERGIAVVAVYCEIASGWRHDREILAVAAERARKAGATLVAESTDRFVRSNDYRSDDNQGAWPTNEDLEDLRCDTRLVPLATLLHPDMPWNQVRRHQITRGREFKGQKGGRPGKKPAGYKKQHRLANWSKVFWMSFCGFTVRRIAALIGVKKTTIQDWLRRMMN